MFVSIHASGSHCFIILFIFPLFKGSQIHRTFQSQSLVHFPDKKCNSHEKSGFWRLLLHIALSLLFPIQVESVRVLTWHNKFFRHMVESWFYYYMKKADELRSNHLFKRNMCNLNTEWSPIISGDSAQNRNNKKPFKPMKCISFDMKQHIYEKVSEGSPESWKAAHTKVYDATCFGFRPWNVLTR